MPIIEEWIGSKKQAKLGDLSLLQENIHFDLMEMEERLGKKFATKDDLKELVTKDEFEDLRGQVGGMEKTLNTVLKTLQSIEGLLKNVATHEPRIRRLEKAALFAK